MTAGVIYAQHVLSQIAYTFIAVLISSGTAGVWAWVTDLLYYDRPQLIVGQFLPYVIVFFVVSVVPNLLGLGMLAALLSQKNRWWYLNSGGRFTPAGLLYGLIILMAATLALDLLDIYGPGTTPVISLPGFYATAAGAGITAIGTAVFWNTRSSRKYA